MKKCKICGCDMTQKTKSYAIIETRTCPFPGITDYDRDYYCWECYGDLCVDKRVKELIANANIKNKEEV
mgnify:CR=1 FL=1